MRSACVFCVVDDMAKCAGSKWFVIVYVNVLSLFTHCFRFEIGTPMLLFKLFVCVCCHPAVWKHLVFLMLQTGVEYAASGCSVVASSLVSSVATCLTAPGIGTGLQWRITVAGQSSGLAGNTSYGRPTISAFSGMLRCKQSTT